MLNMKKMFNIKKNNAENTAQYKSGLVGRVFANGPGDLGSIQGRVTPKTFKMVLDTFLLKSQHYKVRIKGKSGAIQQKE